MKLLLDMNLTPRWVPYLDTAGFETLHWSKVGRADAPDEEIMAYAAKLGFVVLTHDLDFSAILAATKGKKPSVVQIRAQNILPETIGTQVVMALRHTDAELEAGALLTIDPDRTRIRLLPLQQSP
jgi:predicted nuclease of predicted toxin-antitoxin system